MAIRPILTVPDPVLKQVSKPVDAVTDETRALMDDLSPPPVLDLSPSSTWISTA